MSDPARCETCGATVYVPGGVKCCGRCATGFNLPGAERQRYIEKAREGRERARSFAGVLARIPKEER